MEYALGVSAQRLGISYSTHWLEQVFGCGFSLAHIQVLVPVELRK